MAWDDPEPPRNNRGVALYDTVEDLADAKSYRDSEGYFRELDRSELIRQCIHVGLPIIEAMREDPNLEDPSDMAPFDLEMMARQMFDNAMRYEEERDG